MTETTSDLVTKALLAGNVCAFVSAFLNPLDVTKIRMQNQGPASASGLKYKGMVSGALCILKEEGLAGWAKGLTASMIREVTYSSVRMGAYEPIRSVLSNILDRQNDRISEQSKQQVTTSSPVVKFSAALISGGVGSAIANPLDLVKTRFQASKPGEKVPYSSTFGAFLQIHREEGMKGLYKGWIVTSSRAAILTSAQLGSYDTIKNNILINFFGLQEGFILHLAASMASGLITTTAANPVDVIKTRYLSDSSGLYKTPMACITATYKEAGVMGFFKGWTPAYWRLGPHTVLSLLLIERVRAYVGLNPI